MVVEVVDERLDALARILDPGVWEIFDAPAARQEVKDLAVKPSREQAQRILDSGVLAAHEWERREYIQAKQAIIERTSRRGYCYSVDDLLDGYFMHDPRCQRWPDGAIGGSGCIQP